jgi:isopentenyl phosphate kinase
MTPMRSRTGERKADARSKRVTVVKLGGSIISDKGVDFSFREETVTALGRALAESRERVVLVHGGGAFGHPLAKKYGLSSSKSKRTPEGVTETRSAMFDLNRRVCESLRSGGLRPYTFTPFPLFSAAGREGVAWLDDLIDSGLTPVTFGDVTRDSDGFSIISGDTIARELSESMNVSRCIFVMDVDGIMSSDGGLIETFDESGLKDMKSSPSSDATGGIRVKVNEALRMASQGTEVAFVSGFKPDELAKALKRQRFHGTIVRVPSRE